MEESPQLASRTTVQADELSSSLVDRTSISSNVVPAIVLAAVGIWLLGLVGRWTNQSMLRLGFGARRVLNRIIGISQWSIGLLTLAWSMRVVFESLPASVLPLVGVAAMLLLLLSTGTLSDVVGGLLAQFRFALREGDQLTIGAIRGEVSHVHVARVRLRRSDGEEIIVPGRRFLVDLVEIGPLRRATPVTVTIEMTRSLQESEIAYLREQVALIPYRVPQSPLRITHKGDQLEITCHVWQQQATSHVERAIVGACYAALQEYSGSDDN